MRNLLTQHLWSLTHPIPVDSGGVTAKTNIENRNWKSADVVYLYIYICVSIYMCSFEGACAFGRSLHKCTAIVMKCSDFQVGFPSHISTDHSVWVYLAVLLTFWRFDCVFHMQMRKGQLKKPRLAQGFIYLMATNRQLYWHQVTRGWVNEKCASL